VLVVVTIPLVNFALVVDVGFAANHLALVLAVMVAIVVVILSRAHRGP